MCKLFTGPWARKLLELPLIVRLGICGVCCVMSAAFYAFTFPITHDSYIFLVVPMLFAGWIFEKYGACTCFAALMLLQIGCATYFVHDYWTMPVHVFAFVYGTLVLCLEGCLMVSLRGLMKTEKQSRQEAEIARHHWNEAYEQQRQLNQLKNQFILNVNHELRTPLSATYGYLEMLKFLLEKNGYLERTAHAVYLQNALNYCDELCLLVNNVLDTMAIGSDRGELERESLPLNQVVQDVLQHFQIFEQQQHYVQIAIPEQIQVYANVRCLRHVLYNLLSNAFKYSPNTSSVTISSMIHPVSNEVCVSIKDEGYGIPPTEIPLLFKQFVRLQRDLAGTVRGSGLGLYICRHLVEVMGGNIWVESRGIAGLGSCFRFTLPTPPEQVPFVGTRQISALEARGVLLSFNL